MIGPNVDRDLPNNIPPATGLPYVGEPVKAPWWGKIFPFSWIGSWWFGKGAKVVPEDNAGQVETKNEEPESREERADSAALKASAYNPVQAPKRAQTAGYIELFHRIGNVFSFVRFGSGEKSDKQDAQSKNNDSQVLSSQQIQQLPLTTPDGEVQGLTYTQPNALEEKTGDLSNGSADDVVKLEDNKDALHQLLPEESKVEEGEDTGPVPATAVIYLPFGEFTGGEAAIGKGDANTVAVGLGSSNDNKASSLNSDIASNNAPQVLSPKQIYDQKTKRLKQAIDDDDAEKVKILWSDKDFVEAVDKPIWGDNSAAGHTPFAYAIKENKSEVVQFLSIQGCQITRTGDVLNSPTWTYPIEALMRSNLAPELRKQIMRNIINSGFDLSDQKNALDCIKNVIQNCNWPMLGYLMQEQKVDPNIVILLFSRSDVQNKFNQTPVDSVEATPQEKGIMNEVVQDITDWKLYDKKIAELLQTQGVDQEMQDFVAKAILAWGEEVDMHSLLSGKNWYDDIRDQSGNTLLHRAAFNGNLPIVRSLIKYNANVSAKNEWNVTPWHCASHNEHNEVKQLLFEKGAETVPLQTCPTEVIKRGGLGEPPDVTSELYD